MTSKKAELLETFLLLPTISFYYLIMEKGIMANKAEGESMHPTIESSSTVVVDKFFFKFFG